MRADRSEAPAIAITLPATMADIFLALVGVVVIMLLALVPAVRTPGGLQALVPTPVWHSPLLVQGRPAQVFVAERRGLRIGAGDERLVRLDELLDDRRLSERLGELAARDEATILVILPDGHEATFLFGALAGRLELDRIYHLRISADCAHIRDAALTRQCRELPTGQWHP